MEMFNSNRITFTAFTFAGFLDLHLTCSDICPSENLGNGKSKTIVRDNHTGQKKT